MIFGADLSTELLFSFISVVENGGINRTAERLHKTQSAVSMQMQRLEEKVGQKLFLQEGRRKRLTPAGETMLVYARRMLDLQNEALRALQGVALEGELRIGMSHSLAESNLTKELALFAKQYPKILLTVNSADSSDLVTAFGQGDYDYVIYVQKDKGGKGQLLRSYPVHWHAGPDFTFQPGEMLPIVSFNTRCVFRTIGAEALRQAGLLWRDVYRSNSLSALMGAVEGGLGITARTAHAARGKTRILGVDDGLPALPDIHVVYQCQPASMLAELFAEWLSSRLPTVG